nr:global nitrogen regulator [Gronococcus sybilensis]
MSKISEIVPESSLQDLPIYAYSKGKTIRSHSRNVHILLGGILQEESYSNLGGKNLIFDQSLFGSLYKNNTISYSHSNYKCVTNTKVLILRVSEFYSLISDSPEYLYWCFQMLNQRIIDLEQLFILSSHKETLAKLAHFLLLLGKYYGNPSKTGIRLNVNISHEIIADSLNTTRVTVTRLIGKLKKKYYTK